MPTLLLTYHDHSYRIEAHNCPFTIGRLPENDLCLAYDTVSSAHGRIDVKEGQFFYQDLNSTNGTVIHSQDGQGDFVQGSMLSLYKKGIIRLGKVSGPEISFEVDETQEKNEIGNESKIDVGLSFLQRGEYKNAFDIFEALIRENYDYPSAYYYAGFAAAKLENLENAILRFEQYLLFRPDDMSVLIDLGKVYERSGKPDRARNCYRRILDRDSGNIEAQSRIKEIPRFQASASIGGRKHKTIDILGEELTATVDMAPFVVTYKVAAHGRILTDLLKALKSAWQDVGKKLDYFPDGKVPVILLTGDEAAVGETNLSGLTLTINQNHIGERPFLSVLAAHEYAHYALGRMTDFSPNVPWWIQEGFAQHVSQNLTPGRLLDIRPLAQKNRLIPLEALERSALRLKDTEVVRVAYLEAHAAVAFFVKQFGYEGFREVIAALKAGENVKKAFELVGADYERFEREWTEWIVDSAEGVKLTRVVKKGQ